MDLTEALEILIDCTRYVNDDADAYDVELRLSDSNYTFDGAEQAISIIQTYAHQINLPNRHRLSHG